MNAFGHISVGLALGILITPEPILVTAVMMASLLPDIDHRRSTLGRYNPIVGLMKHRGITHTIFGALVMSLPFMYFSNQLCSCVFVGCIGHIFSDKLVSFLPGKSRFELKLW